MPRKPQAEPGTSSELLALKRIDVTLEQLYLDPNNPRFGGGGTPEARIHESRVQENTLTRIEETGIADLVSSVQRYGFAPTDPIVVKAIDDEKYVVLEGNRRVATLRKLVDAHEKAEVTFPDDILGSLKNLQVLVYEGANPEIAWLVQGLRHMSGIKEWPPLQQARFVAKIEKQITRRGRKGPGRPPGVPTVAKAAGVSTVRANRLLRAFYGFEQARQDEEYGDAITDDKFSVFAEAVFRDEKLQQWLGWEENERIFKDTNNLKKLLDWITPSEDGDEPKIARALDVRDVLPDIVRDPDLLARFEKGTVDIDQARAEIAQAKAAHGPDLDSVRQRIQRIIDTLESFPLPRIQNENRKEEFTDLLNTLKERTEFQIRHLGV